MIPPVPPTPKSRLRLIHQLTYLCVALMLAAGVLLAILISNHSNRTAEHAAMDAKNTANCVNNVLGSRNAVTVKETDAQQKFVVADQAFTHALRIVLTSPAAERAADYTAFLVTLNARDKAATAYAQATADAKAYRAKHPLGRC